MDARRSEESAIAPAVSFCERTSALPMPLTPVPAQLLLNVELPLHVIIKPIN
jgi:hypothetical protein